MLQAVAAAGDGDDLGVAQEAVEDGYVAAYWWRQPMARERGVLLQPVNSGFLKSSSQIRTRLSCCTPVSGRTNERMKQVVEAASPPMPQKKPGRSPPRWNGRKGGVASVTFPPRP